MPRPSTVQAVLVIGAAALLVLVFSTRPHVALPPGTLVAEDPTQIAASGRTWERDSFHLTALAEYRIRALVISTERYWVDAGSAVSPIDFAVGWGPMSDQSNLNRISFSQGGRWYRYRSIGKELPLPQDVIASHSANMHLIPADGQVDRFLKNTSAGDLIQLAGYLVEVEGPRGFRWRSSLERTDSGNGACELMWVDAARRSGAKSY